MKRWLVGTSDTSDLRFVNLRWIPRPEDPFARWLVLEVQWNGEVPQGSAPLDALLTRWKKLAESNGRGLPETLFYKLLHVAGVPRTDAVVTVFVDDQTLIISYDASTHRIAVVEAVARQNTSKMARLRLQFALEGLRSSSGALIRGDDAPARVQSILRAHFSKCSRAARAPSFTKEIAEVDYAGLLVEGIKGCAHKDGRFWEQLQIHIELRPEAQGRRSSLYVFGRHAPGYGSGLPGEYPEDIPDAELEAVALDLRTVLEAGSPAPR